MSVYPRGYISDTSSSFCYPGLRKVMTRVPVTEDFGVLGHKCLSSSPQVDTAVKKASQLLLFPWLSFSHLARDLFISLYASLFRPHLKCYLQVLAPLWCWKTGKGVTLSHAKSFWSSPGTLWSAFDQSQIFLSFIVNGFDNVGVTHFLRSCSHVRQKQHRFRLVTRANKFSQVVMNAWNFLPAVVVNILSVHCVKRVIDKAWALLVKKVMYASLLETTKISKQR